MNATAHPTATSSDLKRHYHLCPLCEELTENKFFVRNRPFTREYFHCSQCQLISIPKVYYPAPLDERARYLTHNNDTKDKGYRNFLSQAFEPLKEKLRVPAHGLDFGAGPGPALIEMFEESGFSMTAFDPFFAKDQSALNHTYDFVACTETAEHFHSPLRDFNLINTLLKPGAYLVLLTQTWMKLDAFAEWYYPKDPTHVCFYNQQTFSWLAKHYGWTVEFPSQNVALFKKPTLSN